MTGCKLRSLWCPRLGTCLLLVGLLAVAGLPVLPGQAALAQREPPYAEQNFAEAFKLFADQLYEQAVQAFASFRTTYPDHVNAAEALYYEAAASLALGR